MSVINFIKENIPSHYKPSLLNLQHITQGIYYKGNRFECPCCGWRFRQLLAFGKPLRQNAQCPRCRSLERHRWLVLYLKEQISHLNHPQNLLHFAPVPGVQRNLMLHPKIKYYRTDFSDVPQFKLSMRMDISQLAIASNSFDIILCNHVLEHIDDDYRAMSELFRILKPNGWMITSVPIRLDQPTYEDVAIQSPQARLAAYGQHDHVRYYGYDFPERLENVGFQVATERVDSMDNYLIDRYGLNSDEVFFIAKKP